MNKQQKRSLNHILCSLLAGITLTFSGSLLAKDEYYSSPQAKKLYRLFTNALIEQESVQKESEIDPAASENNFTLLSDPKLTDIDSIYISRYTGNVFLQAPHQYSDLMTGRIINAVAPASRATNVFFTNFHHRRLIDYSAATPNYLIDLSLAYLDVTPKGTIIQLHGFSQAKRQTAAAQQADFILSTGSRYVTSLADQMAQCLKGNGFLNILVYGRDTLELGATLNIVKKTMYENNYSRFLHIEMSFNQRESLLDSTEQQHRLADCIDHIAHLE